MSGLLEQFRSGQKLLLRGSFHPYDHSEKRAATSLHVEGSRASRPRPIQRIKGREGGMNSGALHLHVLSSVWQRSTKEG